VGSQAWLLNIELGGCFVGSLKLNIELPRVSGGVIGVEY
jgi:hypothetical protein